MSQQGSVHSFSTEAKQVHHAPELTDIQGENPIYTAEQSVRPKRIIKPSQKSRENYEITRDEFSSNLSELWDRTVQCMSVLSHSNNDAADLRDCINRLSAKYEHYQRLSAKYTTFLKDTNIEESSAELTRSETVDKERVLLVQSAKDKAELKITHLQETRSHRSTSSRLTSRSSKTSHSRKSTLSDKLIEARANAEAVKVQISYAKREVKLKAEMQAEAAHQQSEAAAEVAKQQAEAARQEAEAARQQSEAAAEAARQQAEAAHQQSEAAAEVAKQQAEAAQQQAEAARPQSEAAAEAARQQAEVARQQAEAAAEVARQQAEAACQQSEAAAKFQGSKQKLH
ncbi:hypothetical protein XELAEV_180169872mg, partial [Xenopus laevis]